MKRFWRLWDSSWYQGLCGGLWAAAVLALPITSLPWLVNLTGASTVAPPSGVLLGLLAVMWLLPYGLRGGKIPVEGQPLLIFLVVALISWGAALFIELPPFRDQGALNEAPEAFTTLLFALVAFFVPAAWLSTSKKNLQRAFRLINLSGAILLTWSLVQLYYVLFQNSDYPLKLIQFQWLFSARNGDPLLFGRLTGFAYEPSWLAHQLNLVYLSFWLAATVQRYTAYRRLWRVSIENLLLLGGLVVLYFSFSRVGLLSFLLGVAYLAIRANLWLARCIQGWLTIRFKSRFAFHWFFRSILTGGLLVAFFAIYAAAAVGMLYLGARVEPRLERIFSSSPFKEPTPYEVINKFEFAERVIYWDTGLITFGEHPLLGVGLGNSGFYFAKNVPAFGWMLTEVTDYLNRQAFIPNTKSLWARLPAETGLVGFAIFLGWYFLLWQSSRLARCSPDPLLKTGGLFGLFVLIAFLTEGFSLDSFALPYLWFSTGLLAATAYQARHSVP